MKKKQVREAEEKSMWNKIGLIIVVAYVIAAMKFLDTFEWGLFLLLKLNPAMALSVGLMSFTMVFLFATGMTLFVLFVVLGERRKK